MLTEQKNIIENNMTDEDIKSILSQPGSKLLDEIIRDADKRIIGYVWKCDKEDCNCNGFWKEDFE